MPVTLEGNNRSTSGLGKDPKFYKAIDQVNYDYDYPEGLNLKPGSELHDSIRDKIMLRARESFNVMSRRHDEWRSIDRVLRAYVPADAGENEEVPQLVIPQSYAALETLLTYFSAAFLQDPIFTYEGVGPEDILGSTLLTHIINVHNQKFQNGLAFHTQWRDAFAYGVGAVSPVWERKMGFKTVRKQQGFMSWVRKQFVVTGEERDRSEWGVLFEGNKVINIDPYHLLLDPNVSAHEVQEGEFFGWVDKTNYMKLRSREQSEGDFIFNAQYLRHFEPETSLWANRGSKGVNKRGGSFEPLTTTHPADVVWMYVNLIPKEWKLGSGEFPEKWLFGVAGDKVVISAMPLGLNHGLIPAAVCAPDYDGYTSNPVSRLGMIHDLQYLSDFLFSSHIHNIKKIINDMIVVDPWLVNVHDLNTPKAGKIIRMSRKAWGKGSLDNAIKQLEVQDVTRGHIGDVAVLRDIIQQTTGATDDLKGVLQPRTSRVSAREFQGIRTSSLARMEKSARIVSMQSMLPVAYMMAAHVQQLMEEETYVNITGEHESMFRQRFNTEQNRVRVNPLDLVVDYDVIPHDGTIPGSEDVNTWLQIFQIIANQPILQQQFDIVRVFKHLAGQLGAKNVEDFQQRVSEVARPDVRTDEDIERQIQAGNIRPATNGI